MGTSMQECETATDDQRLYERAIKLFIYGQLGFLLFLLVCIYLSPKGLQANHGFSYYGDYTLTTIPYRLAFLTACVFGLLSSLLLPDTMPFKVIKLAILLMIPLFLGIVITTAPARPDLDRIHVPLGIALFVIQVALSCWLALFVCRDRQNYAWLGLLIVSGVISILSLISIITILIEGQILFQLAFALLVIHSLSQLKSTIPREEHAP